MNHEREQQMTSDLRRLLQHSVESLDVETKAKLSLARDRAIDSLSRNSRPWSSRRAWVAMPLVLTLALAGILLVQHTNQPEPLPVAGDTLPMQDYSMLSSSQDLELLEDLEFYRWLDEQIEQG